MTELSRFWDGVLTGDAVSAPYDAASEFARVLLSLSGAGSDANQGGVFLGELSNLAYSFPSANTLRLAPGRAIVYGSWYENNGNLNVNIPTPASSTRTDQIVLRKDWAAQTVRVTRIAGTEGAGIPALTQTLGLTWDYPLVRVTITTGVAVTVVDLRTYIGGGSGGSVPNKYTAALVRRSR